MSFMLTYTGAVFDLRYLADGSQMSVLDIAAALSKINRFNGHTNRLYSVAEHSLHVCTVLERDLRVNDCAALLAGLMHDAHEAYIGDMATPLKRVLDDRTRGGWRRVESEIEATVQHRFGYHAAAQAWRQHIKQADLIMLATERRDLLPATGPTWQGLHGVPHAHGISLHDYGAMCPDDWRDAFVERFGELNYGISMSRPPPVPAADTRATHPSHDPETQT
jgi:5'-deoxynucleotidase YfbR-like HD superfamily hydrolase